VRKVEVQGNATKEKGEQTTDIWDMSPYFCPTVLLTVIVTLTTL